MIKVRQKSWSYNGHSHWGYISGHRTVKKKQLYYHLLGGVFLCWLPEYDGRRPRSTISTILCRPVALRHDGYNRNYRRPAIALSYRTTPDDTNLARNRATIYTLSFPLSCQSYAMSWCVSSDKRVTNLPSLCHTIKSVVLYIAARSARRLSEQTHTSDSVYGGLGYPEW